MRTESVPSDVSHTAPEPFTVPAIGQTPERHPFKRALARKAVVLAAALSGIALVGNTAAADDQEGSETPPAPAGPIAPGAKLCFPVEGNPQDVAVVNLTPVNASGAGNGQLISSDVLEPPVASNVNFGPGSVDPNVAFAPIGEDGTVCYINSDHSDVDLVADHLGTIRSEAFIPASESGAPERLMDTRISLSGPTLQPKEIRCFDVDAPYGSAAIVNLTPVNAVRPGNGQLVSFDVKDNTPVASNVNFGPGSVDPNVAITPTGLTTGAVCVENSPHGPVDIVADYLGAIVADYYVPASQDGAPDRKADTRQSGDIIAPGAKLCFPVEGNPQDVAVVNLTPVNASGAGNGQLISSDVLEPPVASNVNFGPGSVDPNVAFAPIGEDGTVCYINSDHSDVDLVADHLGTIRSEAFIPASESGAPERVADTRSSGPEPDPEPRQAGVEVKFVEGGNPIDLQDIRIECNYEIYNDSGSRRKLVEVEVVNLKPDPDPYDPAPNGADIMLAEFIEYEPLPGGGTGRWELHGGSAADGEGIARAGVATAAANLAWAERFTPESMKVTRMELPSGEQSTVHLSVDIPCTLAPQSF